MKKHIPFYKISAAGNDFVLIDNRKKILPRNLSSLAYTVCHRKYSVGADGLLVLEHSKKADFRMHYYNSDGSRAEMCGNGGRSIARFAHIIGVASSKMTFETDAGLVRAQVLGKNVRLNLYEPKDVHIDFPLKVHKREFNVSYINTGVPHTVVIVDHLEKVDVVVLGRMLRYHKKFAPAGTNVNFIEKKDSKTLIVRTYERGVEDETLACGTGVVASALVAGLKGLVKPIVTCKTRSGNALRVSYVLNYEHDLISPVSNVSLEGPAEVTFTGSVSL